MNNQNIHVVGSNPTQRYELKQIKQFAIDECFLAVNVYKFPLGNCGGITDSVDTIYIQADRGNHTFSQLNARDLLHLVFVEEQRGPDYWALKPLLQPVGVCGPMAGGNLAYSSDSRCKRIYHIHDRFETQEANDTLSR